jgi:CRP/FNR family transcriptional regulator
MRHITFCSVLEPQDISRLAAIVRQTQIAPRQMLFQEGDPAHEVFNVLEGAIKISKSLPDGRTQITGFLFPGDFLGLSAKGNYSYSAEAITEVKLCRFQRRDLTRLFRDFPTLVDRLLTIANDELAVAQEQMLLLGRKTAQEKIVTFLLAMADRAKRRGQADRRLHLPMSRAEIADYLGLTVETVSRTMTKLRGQGAIRLPKPQDVVLAENFDWQALAEGPG